MAYRYVSIDVLRGIAIFLMVFLEALNIHSSAPTHWYGDLRLFEILQITPTLLIVSGASLFFWFQTLQFPQNITRPIKRFFLLVFGFYALYIVMWGPTNELYGAYALIDWEIIPVIGVITLLLRFFYFVPASYFIFIAFFIYFISPLFHWWINSIAFWDLENFLPSHAKSVAVLRNHFGVDYYNFWTIITSLFVTGWYGLFPWAGYAFIGFWAANQIQNKKMKPILYVALITLIMGASILILNQVLFDAYWLWQYRHFPATLPTVLINTSAHLMLFALIFQIYDTNRKYPGKISLFFMRIGQNALSFYMVALFINITVMKVASAYAFGINLSDKSPIEAIIILYKFWFALYPYKEDVTFTLWFDLFTIPQTIIYATFLNAGIYMFFHRMRYKPFENIQNSQKQRFIN